MGKPKQVNVLFKERDGTVYKMIVRTPVGTVKLIATMVDVNAVVKSNLNEEVHDRFDYGSAAYNAAVDAAGHCFNCSWDSGRDIERIIIREAK